MTKEMRGYKGHRKGFTLIEITLVSARAIIDEWKLKIEGNMLYFKIKFNDRNNVKVKIEYNLKRDRITSMEIND